MAGIGWLPCFFGGGGTTHGHRFFTCIIRRGVGGSNGGGRGVRLGCALKSLAAQELGDDGLLERGAAGRVVRVEVALVFVQLVRECGRAIECLVETGDRAGVPHAGHFELEDFAGGGAGGGTGRVGEVGAEDGDGREDGLGPFGAAVGGGGGHGAAPGGVRWFGGIVYTDSRKSNCGRVWLEMFVVNREILASVRCESPAMEGPLPAAEEAGRATCYQSAPSTSPPAGVTADQNVSADTPGARVRTLPSASATKMP
jgi:hypothetical protein